MDWVAGNVESARTPNMAALGSNSRSNCSRFGANSACKLAMPVTFAPGRFRLATSPTATGSPPALKTMGMVEVAAFATCAATVPAPAVDEGRGAHAQDAHGCKDKDGDCAK